MDCENKVISLINPASRYVEAYKKLQMNIEYSSVDKKVQVIQITSSLASEGKTSTSSNLAVIYAMKEKKVLLIDLDLRKPKIHKSFNMSNEKGLTDYLADNATLEEIVNKHECGVDIITRGKKVPNVELTLDSEKLKKFIDDMRKIYDIIILDCPPVLAVTDSLIVSKLADGVVFVIGYNKTKKPDAKHALQDLKNSGANIIGCVLTQFKGASSGYYSYKYYNSYYAEEEKI